MLRIWNTTQHLCTNKIIMDAWIRSLDYNVTGKLLAVGLSNGTVNICATELVYRFIDLKKIDNYRLQRAHESGVHNQTGQQTNSRVEVFAREGKQTPSSGVRTCINLDSSH